MGDVSINTPLETSDRGAQGSPVFILDQTTDVLDIPFLKTISSSATTTADTVIDSYTIELTAAHGASIGSVIELANGDNVFYQGKVITSNANDLVMDTPLNHVYTSGATVFESTDQMLVNGSATPQVFSILPLAGQRGDIVRIIIAITGTSAQDFETFGSDAALTRGVVIRVKKENGDFRNQFNFKTNGQYQERSFDVDYRSNTGNSVRSFAGRRTYGGPSKNGVVIRVEGDKNEEIQIVIQDDLVTASSNTSFRAYAQGHELQE